MNFRTSLQAKFRTSLYASLLSSWLIASPAFASPRELNTDRPDTTESAYSVDRGRLQCEWELASATRDGGRFTEYALFEVNAKYGLTDSSDLQLVLPFFTRVRGAGEGFGDVVLRLKHNLWGNDGGQTALALMPYVKLPTASGRLGNGQFEGGLIVPFAFSGPEGWGFGLMAEVDIVSGDAGDHHAEILLSATAAHDLTRTTAAFAEVVGIFRFESGADSEAYFNTGLTLALAENWQLDGGLRIGLTHSATDFTPFCGLSMKF